LSNITFSQELMCTIHRNPWARSPLSLTLDILPLSDSKRKADAVGVVPFPWNRRHQDTKTSTA
jgi:hypothetical protein